MDHPSGFKKKKTLPGFGTSPPGSQHFPAATGPRLRLHGLRRLSARRCGGAGLEAAEGAAPALAAWRGPNEHQLGLLGFLKWGYPKMDGFSRENPSKMDDLGVSLFQETTVFL